MILPDAGLFKLLTRRDRLQWFGLREAINNLSRSARSAVAYELSCALKRHKVDACADDTEDALGTFALRLTMRLQDTTIERDFERHTVQAWATAPEAQRPMMPRLCSCGGAIPAHVRESNEALSSVPLASLMPDDA